MKLSRNNIRRKAFTLVELLTVIAIIGILAALIIPAVGSVKTKANQAKSSSNMRQIALGYNNYSTSGSRTRNIREGGFSAEDNRQASSPKEFANVLAYHVDLSDAALWFISSDERQDQIDQLPTFVGSRAADGGWNENADWTALAGDDVSYSVAVGLSTNSPTSTTPLLWTTGLDDSGNWEATSPWSGKGGHIAFVDGHVSFYQNISDDENQLVSGTAAGSPGEPTSSIDDAISTSSNATALERSQ